MASIITELIDTLKEQKNLYSEILEIAPEKKLAIIENNVENLQKTVSKENALIGKNQRLDRKRIEIFGDISTVLAMPIDITLKDIIEALKGQDGEQELASLRDDILNIIEKLNTINTQNQELIQMSIDYVNFSMNVIRDSSKETPTIYDLNGNEIDMNNKKMFDAKQ